MLNGENIKLSGQGKKAKLRRNVVSTLLDQAKKRFRDDDDSDHRSENDNDDDDEPASKRQAILLTLWMYCIISFDCSVMKVGITASEDQARDCNASTYYGTCFSKYFPIRVSLVSLSALSSCCPAIFVTLSPSHFRLGPAKAYSFPRSAIHN